MSLKFDNGINFKIDSLTNCYFITPDGEQIEMDGVINDVEVKLESIPKGTYTPKPGWESKNIMLDESELIGAKLDESN